MVYGYARISKPSQNIERQVRNILAYDKNAIIFKEAYTGRTLLRKELLKLLKIVKKGDTIVFDAVSRMGRCAEEGMELYEELFRMNVELVFLKERNVDTAVYRQAIQRQISIVIKTGNKAADSFLEKIIEALNDFSMELAKQQIEFYFQQAEKEVVDLSRRTSEGLQTAKINGKHVGRPKGKPVITKKSIQAKKKILRFNRTFQGTMTDKETWEYCGITKVTFYKYKKELISDYVSENVKDKNYFKRLIDASVFETVKNKDKREKMEKILIYNKDYGGELSNTETCTQVGVSPPTLYKYKSEIDLILSKKK